MPRRGTDALARSRGGPDPRDHNDRSPTIRSSRASAVPNHQWRQNLAAPPGAELVVGRVRLDERRRCSYKFSSSDVCHKPLINSGSMNRYALEMYARERHQNYMAEPPRNPTTSAKPPLLGFLSCRVERANVHQSESPRDDSMTFIYELRCDLVDIDLDEILPMIK
jgi:hypothetical protein